uniref:hypothetical protein n=1 Tax=Streptomyces hawaiiensis TaxID=67305 RepID=UPI0031D7A5DF
MLTGEHGAGVLMVQWVAEGLGPAAHAVRRRIRRLSTRGPVEPRQDAPTCRDRVGAGASAASGPAACGLPPRSV